MAAVQGPEALDCCRLQSNDKIGTAACYPRVLVNRSEGLISFFSLVEFASGLLRQS
jgi:hypothetical protein